MQSHGAKSSYMEKVQKIPVQFDQLVLHSALYVGVDFAQTR